MDQPQPGTILGHYRILRRIGAGGMGVVYEAQDLKLGRHVAIKMLAGTSPDPLTLERFWREARTASALNHPGICTVYEINDSLTQPFLVMELLDGDSLDRLYGGRPMPIPQLIDLGIQVADAIDAAHRRSVLHRDIKPANIYVLPGGQIKILDFGLARFDTGDSESAVSLPRHMLTTPGSALGTIAYMSPEQARGESVDARSDIFSLGVVLYEMATGYHPFGGATTAVVFDKLLNYNPPAPTSLNHEIPPGIEHILAKALEKDRELRYQSAADLRADLRRLQRGASHPVPAAAVTPLPAYGNQLPAQPPVQPAAAQHPSQYPGMTRVGSAPSQTPAASPVQAAPAIQTPPARPAPPPAQPAAQSPLQTPPQPPPQARALTPASPAAQHPDPVLPPLRPSLHTAPAPAPKPAAKPVPETVRESAAAEPAAPEPVAPQPPADISDTLIRPAALPHSPQASTGVASVPAPAPVSAPRSVSSGSVPAAARRSAGQRKPSRIPEGQANRDSVVGKTVIIVAAVVITVAAIWSGVAHQNDDSNVPAASSSVPATPNNPSGVAPVSAQTTTPSAAPASPTPAAFSPVTDKGVQMQFATGSCQGTLHLTAASLHFACPGHSLSLTHAQVQAISGNAIIDQSGNQWTFTIQGMTPDQVQTLLSTWYAALPPESTQQ